MEKKAQKVIMRNYKLYEDDPIDGTNINMTDNVFEPLFYFRTALPLCFL